ncbi:major facilitator superfamily transporter [Xylariales sp. PMI_506]|nr:major facilitator superfamily transporter [Xylariales sp. PMI_506]
MSQPQTVATADIKESTIVNSSDLTTHNVLDNTDGGELGSGDSESGSSKGRPRSKEEKRLLRKLDFFILSWACFGYFLRLLDTTNMTNAYVSGMKEDLNLLSNQYNLFTTFWTIGYTVGMIPSQVITTWVRPSLWIPAAEIIWAIITFCFAAVTSAKQIYAMRFLIGLFESPFYIGAMTLLGNWYTPRELATRAGIFYSASFAANMFSGYLQAAVYTGLDGVHGLAGWRWLFIICGCINVPGALWGFFAVPDSPFNTRVFYLNKAESDLARTRMEELKRENFKGTTLKTFAKTLSRPFVWVFVINYIFFCLNTYGLSFFAIYLKALGTYTVQEVNVIPTAAYAVGLVGTIFWGFLSDKLNTRIWIAVAITAVNIVSNAVLAAAPSKGGIFFGYIINAATYAYGPVIISYLNETFSVLADERALILGIAQALGAAFNAWVPLFIFNTGTQSPLFHVGFSTAAACGGAQLIGLLLLRHFGRKVREQTGAKIGE